MWMFGRSPSIAEGSGSAIGISSTAVYRGIWLMHHDTREVTALNL